MAGRPKTKPD